MYLEIQINCYANCPWKFKNPLLWNFWSSENVFYKIEDFEVDFFF